MADYPSPPLTTSQLQNRAAVRSSSTASFIFSPLNPAFPPHSYPFARSPSRSSTTLSKFMPAYDDSAQGSLLSPHYTGNSDQRSSITVSLTNGTAPRQISSPRALRTAAIMTPSSCLPNFPLTENLSFRRPATRSSPSAPTQGTPPAFKPSEASYDPVLDELDAPDEEDFLSHDPTRKDGLRSPKSAFPWSYRLLCILTLIVALLILFASRPVVHFSITEGRTIRSLANIRINNTGQSPALLQGLKPIHPVTTREARVGFDGQKFELAFSDEFKREIVLSIRR